MIEVDNRLVGTVPDSVGNLKNLIELVMGEHMMQIEWKFH